MTQKEPNPNTQGTRPPPPPPPNRSIRDGVAKIPDSFTIPEHHLRDIRRTYEMETVNKHRAQLAIKIDEYEEIIQELRSALEECLPSFIHNSYRIIHNFEFNDPKYIDAIKALKRSRDYEALLEKLSEKE